MKDVINPINTSDGLFHDGDQSTGALGTIVTAQFQNDVQAGLQNAQAELIKIIKTANAAAVLDPDKTDQVLTALYALFLRSANNFSEIKLAGAASVATALTNLGSSDGTLNGRLIGSPKVILASGNYTWSAGTRFIRVRAIAAGGGGGGCPATSSSQTGGSQAGFYGQYIDVIIPVSALTAPVAVVIGSGGVGGAAGANQGTTGGNTSFGSIFTLGGGPGGSPGNVNSGAIVGGIGVYTGRTLTSTITPINSSNGMASSTQFYQSTAGVALGYSSVQSAIEGGFYGRGGEGLYLVSSSGAAAGGTGKSGLMIIEEYA